MGGEGRRGEGQVERGGMGSGEEGKGHVGIGGKGGWEWRGGKGQVGMGGEWRGGDGRGQDFWGGEGWNEDGCGGERGKGMGGEGRRGEWRDDGGWPKFYLSLLEMHSFTFRCFTLLYSILSSNSLSSIITFAPKEISSPFCLLIAAPTDPPLPPPPFRWFARKPPLLHPLPYCRSRW